MARKQFPTIADAIATSDDAASANTLAVRDGSGDLYANRLRPALGLRNQGDWHRNFANKTVGYAVVDGDDVLTVDSTGGNVTITLPAAAASSGKVVTVVKKVAANNVTIQGSGAELINGANTLVLAAQYAAKTLICDGVQWYVIAS